MNAGPEAVRPEDGGVAGRHGGGAVGVGLGAGALVVTPDGTRLNRIWDRERPARDGTGHSTPAYGRAYRKKIWGPLLGARPRRLRV
jgi:hypothetical protein